MLLLLLLPPTFFVTPLRCCSCCCSCPRNDFCSRNCCCRACSSACSSALCTPAPVPAAAAAGPGCAGGRGAGGKPVAAGGMCLAKFAMPCSIPAANPALNVGSCNAAGLVRGAENGSSVGGASTSCLEAAPGVIFSGLISTSWRRWGCCPCSMSSCICCCCCWRAACDESCSCCCARSSCSCCCWLVARLDPDGSRPAPMPAAVPALPALPLRLGLPAAVCRHSESQSADAPVLTTPAGPCCCSHADGSPYRVLQRTCCCGCCCKLVWEAARTVVS